MPLEELNFSLVLFSPGARLECAQVPSPARLGILLAGIQPILAGFQLANHRTNRAFLGMRQTLSLQGKG